MDKGTVVRFRRKEEIVDPLAARLRRAARDLIGRAVVEEFEIFLERHSRVLGGRGTVENSAPRPTIIDGSDPSPLETFTSRSGNMGCLLSPGVSQIRVFQVNVSYTNRWMCSRWVIKDMVDEDMVNPTGVFHNPIAPEKGWTFDNPRAHVPVKFR